MSRKTAAEKKIRGLEIDIETLTEEVERLVRKLMEEKRTAELLKKFIQEGKDILDKQKIAATIDAQVVGFLVQLLTKERSGSEELTELDTELHGLKKEKGRADG